MNKKRERMKKEWKEKELKEKIKRILTDQKLSAIKAMLEKDHAIDCMLLLLMNRGKWGKAKAFMRKLRLTLPDGTFRARMLEIADLKLATQKNIGNHPNHYRYEITNFGIKVTQLLMDFFYRIV